jgi:hypothetical protein
LACFDRAVFERFRAAPFACLDSALVEAADRLSLFSARVVACERLRETVAELPARALRTSRAACFRVRLLAWPAFGGGNFTPARRAFDKPIAMACFVDRAPCLPSRI